jgi:hypothetical protein
VNGDRLRSGHQGVVSPVSKGDRRPRCRPSSPPGDYLDRLTVAAELRRDAARAVASAVARGYGCGSFMVCGQLRTFTVRGARGRLPPA